MDKRIKNLRTVKDCANFERNALRLKEPELAEQCRMRAIQISAEDFLDGEEASAPEVEAVEALFAYEQVLSDKNGKKTRAAYTRRMFKSHGILAGMERAVSRAKATDGFDALVETGKSDQAFEAVILRHPDEFSDDVVAMSKKRMAAVKS